MANLWILNQFRKGNKSCIADAIVTRLHKHCCVMTIHNCLKFHKIPFNGVLIMTQLLILMQFNGNNSCITKVLKTELDYLVSLEW